MGENALAIFCCVIMGLILNTNPPKEAVPKGVVSSTEPVAPLPTIVIMVEDETTVKETTGTLPKLRSVVPVKFLPLIVIKSPASALVGVKLVITGAGIKVNPLILAEPPGVVRLTAPVDPFPTTAMIA